LLALVVTGLGLSCNSEVVGPEFNPPKSASIYTYISDSPACDVLGFRMNISGLKFRRSSNAESFATVFPTETTFVSLRFDFAALRDMSTLMYLSTLNVDTYDRAELTLQLPKIVVYDTAEDPPIRVINGVLSTATPSIPLSPAFGITEAKLNVLRFDFDMAKSLQLDTSGQVTEDIIPVFTAIPVAQAADTTYGTFDNLVGFITQVSANPVGAFIGTFNLQMHSGTGQSIPISVKPDTSLSGVPDLKSLETGRIAEVLAKVDEKGNIVAEQVEMEDRSVVEEKRIAFFGTVLPTPVKDASGNVTQLKLYLRAMEPDRGVEVLLDSILTVNIPPGAHFQVSPRPDNLTPLQFGPTSIAVGQELLVHGQYTVVTDQPTVVDATSIYLRPQTLQGGLSSLISVGSDGKSGAFWLTGCSTLLQTTPIMVMTTNVDTAFIDVFGLAEILPQSPLYVRGFPFYVKDATVIRGTPVPAGTLVLFATQVRQAT
jgi:hypothetical protein